MCATGVKLADSPRVLGFYENSAERLADRVNTKLKGIVNLMQETGVSVGVDAILTLCIAVMSTGGVQEGGGMNRVTTPAHIPRQKDPPGHGLGGGFDTRNNGNLSAEPCRIAIAACGPTPNMASDNGPTHIEKRQCRLVTYAKSGTQLNAFRQERLAGITSTTSPAPYIRLRAPHVRAARNTATHRDPPAAARPGSRASPKRPARPSTPGCCAPSSCAASSR